MRNSIYVMGKDIPVSWIPLIPRMSGPDIRGISVYVKSTYTENSWALPWSGQQVVTRVETLIFSKYLVGSRANPWHGHVVGKSLVLVYQWPMLSNFFKIHSFFPIFSRFSSTFQDCFITRHFPKCYLLYLEYFHQFFIIFSSTFFSQFFNIYSYFKDFTFICLI